MFRLANKKIEASGLSIKMEQLPVLMTIFFCGPVDQATIAELTARDKSSVFRTVCVLSKKNLIACKDNDQDARKKMLILTEAGMAKGRQILQLTNEIEVIVSHVLTGMPKFELIKMLHQAYDSIEKLVESESFGQDNKQ